MSPAEPGAGVRTARWIAPYLKGPDDAPLIGGDKVTVVGAGQGDAVAGTGTPVP